MRLQGLLKPACLTALSLVPARAQDPWRDLKAALHREEVWNPRARWVLLTPENLGKSLLEAEPLVEARGWDLRRRPGPPEALKDAGRELLLSPAPDWILLDPAGEVALHGQGEPDPRRIRKRMDEGGWRPLPELQRDFLKAHPGHGDALADHFGLLQRRGATFLTRAFRKMGDSKDAADGDKRFNAAYAQELATPWARAYFLDPALAALSAMAEQPASDPEWSRRLQLVLLDPGQGEAGAPLQAALKAHRIRLEAQIGQYPLDDSLWFQWRTLNLAVPGGNAEALVRAIDPVPGTPWPTREAAATLVDGIKPDQRLERAEIELALPDPEGHRFKAWAGIRLEALTALHRWEEARAWILAARRREVEPFGPDPLAFLDDKNPRKALLQEMMATPLPSSAATGEGLVLALLGSPDSLPTLLRHPELDPWSHSTGLFGLGGDWIVHTPNPADEAALRLRHKLPEGPRWALIRHSSDREDLLAQGPGLPDPAKLAARLREVAPPLLERLETYLRRHLGHRLALEKLAEVLSERMPHPRLELRLARACAELGEAPILRKEDFQPQRPLWRAAARKALPAAEARLSRWPESLDAWMAWMDWQSLMDRPASPTSHLHTLAVWKSRLRGGPGPLPLNVAAGVAQRLEAEGRWKDLAEWGLHQWEGGWKQVLGALGASTEGSRDQSRRKELATLVGTTLAALRRAGRRGEAEAFREELQRGDKSLLAEMGRVKK